MIEPVDQGNSFPHHVTGAQVTNVYNPCENRMDVYMDRKKIQFYKSKSLHSTPGLSKGQKPLRLQKEVNGV